MDYIKKTDFNVWDNLDDCLNELSPTSTYSVSTKGETLYTDLKYSRGDTFIFGPESRGLSISIRNQYSSIYMPMRSKGRSLNLANAVSVITYEVWRQLGFN